MKKVLLIAISFAFSAGMMAQTSVTQLSGPVKSEGLTVKQTVQDMPRVINVEMLRMFDEMRAGFKANGSREVTKVQMGSSYNPYTLLVSEQTSMTADPDLGVVMFTHRQCNTYAGGSGFVQVSFSADGGTTFDSSLVVWDYASTGRYPQGAIYNPAGNTDYLQAYAVISGPTTDGAGWVGNFLASMKLDGTNKDNIYVAYADTATGATYQTFIRNFMHSTADGIIHTYGDANTDDGTNYTSFKTIVDVGTFNAGNNAFDWTDFTHVPGYPMYQGFPDGYRSPGLATSADGSTQYLVYIGRDVTAPDTLSYMPMIYKSVDGGATWTKEAAYDWSGSTAIVENLSGAPMRPMFGLVKDALVDGNGHLHIATFVNSAASDHPDSLGYYMAYANIKGFAYDVYQTATGWDALIIDTIWSADVDAASDALGMGGWDERLQMSKSPDGKKVFYAWMDTNVDLGLDMNLLPDIEVRGFDVDNGSMTLPKNLTKGTFYESDNYFMFFSDKCLVNGTDYILPISTSQLGSTDLSPAIHFYLKDAMFNETEFVGIQVNEVVSDFNIYPNPNNGTFSINYTMKNADKAIVRVLNTLGAVVFEENVHVNGTLRKDYNFSLPSGLYFVEVESAAGKTVKKMIRK